MKITKNGDLKISKEEFAEKSAEAIEVLMDKENDTNATMFFFLSLYSAHLMAVLFDGK